MQPLNPQVAQQMRERARAIRDRQAQGNFTRSWGLSGKQAIVEPGQSVTVRLMPRWDYASSKVVDPKTNQRVPNPVYKFDQPAYVMAYEHWWDTEAGRTIREWCPRTLDPESDCPICQSSTVLIASATKEDRDFGNRIKVRAVFIFNAVIDFPRRLGQDGLVDIRPISCSETIFNKIVDIIDGGDNPQFQHGDITDPREGYDLAFRRPVMGQGNRWDVQAAPGSSTLFNKADPAQVAAFRGWATRMVDLEEMLQKETKDSVAIFRAYYGRDPEPGEVKGVRGVNTAQDDDSPAQPASAAPPVSPDDEFMPPVPVSQRAPSRAPALAPATAPSGRSKVSPRPPRR